MMCGVLREGHPWTQKRLPTYQRGGRELEALLAEHPDVTKKMVAMSIAVDTATIYRWRKQPGPARRSRHLAALALSNIPTMAQEGVHRPVHRDNDQPPLNSTPPLNTSRGGRVGDLTTGKSALGNRGVTPIRRGLTQQEVRMERVRTLWEALAPLVESDPVAKLLLAQIRAETIAAVEGGDSSVDPFPGV